MSGWNFANQNLTQAFLNSNLTGADFTNANLTDTQVFSSNLTAANFTNANLTNANLGGSTLTGANFSGANVTRAHLSSTTGFTASQLYSTQSYIDGNLTGITPWK